MRSLYSLPILLCTVILAPVGLGGCGKSGPTPPVEMVTKVDGSNVPLTDLEEICKDVVFNKAKILKHTREGDLAKAAEARAYFKSFSADLKAYAPKDREACMYKFDTPSNVAKFQ